MNPSSKSRQAPRKPRQILLSKRANVFYLEHARVMQKDERVLYLTDTGEDVEQFFNIPERNTMFLLLGKGTSITDAAARRLAESNVVVGFCGSGGSPLFGTTDPVFLSPQSEYRPTEYMQGWVSWWFDEAARLAKAKALLAYRIELARDSWSKHSFLRERKTILPPSLAKNFSDKAQAATSTQELLAAEGEWARKLYHWLAASYKIKEFSRQEGVGRQETAADRVNSYLDHGNYLAYGYAAVVLNGLGISFSLPLLHGKTRRGALVFDVADLLKDAFVMPLAFDVGSREGNLSRELRGRITERVVETGVIDELFTFVERLAESTP